VGRLVGVADGDALCVGVADGVALCVVARGFTGVVEAFVAGWCRFAGLGCCGWLVVSWLAGVPATPIPTAAAVSTPAAALASASTRVVRR
jgi:hypothetical protein